MKRRLRRHMERQAAAAKLDSQLQDLALFTVEVYGKALDELEGPMQALAALELARGLVLHECKRGMSAERFQKFCAEADEQKDRLRVEEMIEFFDMIDPAWRGAAFAGEPN